MNSSRTLASGAYDHLRDLIVSLQIAPGAPLAELELCRRLGVSRTPIRSALQRLQQEGLAVSQTAGAASRLLVAPLTSSDMRQLFLMVGALDGVSARLAAELDEVARGRLCATLGQLIGRLISLLEADDLTQVTTAQAIDLQFHRAYEEAAAGPQLRAELAALHARRERYVRVYTEALVQAHHLRDSVTEHQAILDAIRRADVEGAERAAEANFRNAIVRFDRLVTVLGERGSWY